MDYHELQPGSLSPEREAYIARRISALMIERAQEDLSATTLKLNSQELISLQLEQYRIPAVRDALAHHTYHSHHQQRVA